MKFVLDTNIISAVLKGNQPVINKIEAVLRAGNQVHINCLSYYEVKRGLLAVGAGSKLSVFENLCNQLGLILLDDIAIFEIAAEIYSDLQKKGKLIEDADILIAALAKAKDLTLVTDNTRHFSRINLNLENWIVKG